MRKIIILISFILLLGGCYDYKELNDMSIVSGIGIDYKDGKYIVDLEITKSSKDGSSTEIQTYLVSGEDENISDAFTIAKNRSDKLVYMEHVEVLVLGKELCDKGIIEAIDYIIRDTGINNNYFIVVTDNPKELLNTKIENKSTAEVIVNTVKYYYENTTLDDVDITASYMINEKEDIAFPYIKLEEENIIFNDILYFDDDKDVGFIDSKMFAFLKLDSTNINFTNNGNTISVYKKDVGYEVKDNEVIINIKVSATIKEINKDTKLTEVDSYSMLEDNFSKVIKQESMDFIKETLDKKSDLLGLEDIYYKKYKKENDNMKYTINVDVTINRNGTIYGVLHAN